MIRDVLFALVALLLPVAQSQFLCADQIQRCGVMTEDYERQIQEVKTAAFRACFSKSVCQQEWTLFDDCFQRSLRAVRAPFNEDRLNPDGFGEAAQRYRATLDQCFTGAPAIPISDLSAAFVDDDAVYARAVYGVELADRLWALPETIGQKPNLDTDAACLIKDYGERLFGGGISRMVDSSDPRLNNLNNSCLLSDYEVRCYRRFLDNDQDFLQLVATRDRALRSCIQSIRLQTQCRTADGSRLRSCICNAREEFESRVQSAILDCVRRSDNTLSAANTFGGGGQQYSLTISHNAGIRSRAPPNVARASTIRQAQPQFEETIIEHQPTIMPGVVINGQCLCACANGPAVLSSPAAAFSPPASPTLIPELPPPLRMSEDSATSSAWRPWHYGSPDTSTGIDPTPTTYEQVYWNRNLQPRQKRMELKVERNGN